MSDSENRASEVQEVDSEVQPYVDAADRLERTLDAQLQKIRDIDSRAGFVIRIVAILLGVVVSAASIIATLQVDGSSGVVEFPSIAVFTAVVGALGLVGSMTMAIVTYLSSQQLPGLDYRTAGMLSDPNYETDMEEHVKSTLAVYNYMLWINGRIIQTNAARLRLTLTLLVVGIVYGTLASAFVVSGGGAVEGQLLIVVTAAMAVVVWYIQTEKYKVEQPEEEDIHDLSE